MQSGSCHCGAVRFTAEGQPDRAIECNCSHCSSKGLLLWFVPESALVVVAGQEKLTTYTFNKHVIRHQFCSDCGSQPFSIGRRPDGVETAAVNVRCLDDIELERIPRVPVNGREF
ncbi:GFA family protein [Luteimonas granuli]|uniref:GFA family protein n=1 Tax=Luteimonas granuli TaxID=1176533 RepID=A0A518N463_9GAMM|nr:GFA family protein [Luteimonas granuli]QDW66719.1 GFA family protein [Luteimonas granuli]